MSFMGFGPGGQPTSGLRFGQTRGRIQGSAGYGVNYPSPFFDVAHTYLPVTVKNLFRWCRYYFLTNPLINATVFKLSEYPITDIMIDHENKNVSNQWLEYYQDHLRWRSFQVEVGLDYHTYGNAFISLGFPFKKYLRCTTCGLEEVASKCRKNWVFTNHAFRFTCPKCGETGDAVAKDVYFKNPSGIKLIRWNPEDIEVTHNDISGKTTYFYTIPAPIRNDVLIGKKDVVEEIPQVFIQALKEQKGIVFSPDNFFHMRRPTLADRDRGWGIPLLLPVLKDTFHLQIMKKAQEALLLEHVVPLRILFPQPGSGSSDPYTSINLMDWRDHVAQEIARWRIDNNYMPIMPLPLGNQTVGGDGKALLLAGEIQQWSEHLMMGMGVPREFLIGGMSYAGTNVSMRMLENAFIGYLIQHKAMARWAMELLSNYLEWPDAHTRYKPFKMADDIQRKAYLFQLNQAQKVSDTTLLADADLSQEEEYEIMSTEADRKMEISKKQTLAMAEVQGEQQLIMMKYQTRAQIEQQKSMMEAQTPPAGAPGGANAVGGGAPGGTDATPAVGQTPPSAGNSGFLAALTSQVSEKNRLQQGSAGIDLPSFAMAQAQAIAAMPPEQQQMAISNLRAQSPELAALVEQMLRSMQPAAQSTGTDGRPLPEKLPERRAAKSV